MSIVTMLNPPADNAERLKLIKLSIKKLKPDAMIFVEADAGGGKTHTCKLFLDAHPDTRIHYMSFCNTNIYDMNEKLGKSRTFRIFGRYWSQARHIRSTFDSFCWQMCGWAKRCPKQTFDKLDTYLIKWLREQADRAGDNKHIREFRQTILRSSTIPDDWWGYDFLGWCKEKEVRDQEIYNYYTLALVRLKELRTHHNVYIIDEAQDLKEIALVLFKYLPAIKIFVGDGKQSIYGDATSKKNRVYNVFKYFKCDKITKIKLSVSFRTGQTLLNWVSTNMDHKCVSSSRIDTKYEFGTEWKQFFSTKQPEQTGAMLEPNWLYIIEIFLENYKRHKDTHFYITRDDLNKIATREKLRKMCISELKSLGLSYKLTLREKDKNNFQSHLLRKGKEWLMDYLPPAYNKFIGFNDIYGKYNYIKGANIIRLSTIHGFKGSEAGYVYVSENSLPINQTHGDWIHRTNLFYVAVTRPTHRLRLPKHEGKPCDPPDWEEPQINDLMGRPIKKRKL